MCLGSRGCNEQTCGGEPHPGFCCSVFVSLRRYQEALLSVVGVVGQEGSRIPSPWSALLALYSQRTGPSRVICSSGELGMFGLEIAGCFSLRSDRHNTPALPPQTLGLIPERRVRCEAILPFLGASLTHVAGGCRLYYLAIIRCNRPLVGSSPSRRLEAGSRGRAYYWAYM